MPFDLTAGEKKVIAINLDGPLDMAVAGNELYVAEAKVGRISLPLVHPSNEAH